MCGNTKKTSQYEAMNFTAADGHDLPYRILLPENYSKVKDYPLLVFLHGSGERGNDNTKQLAHISSNFLTEDFRKNYPAIIVFPQCAESDTWSPVDEVDGKWFVGQAQNATPSMQALTELLDELIVKYPIQRNRMYVAGLSMGGFGTMELLNRMPETFAAAVSICGGGNRRMVHKYIEVPIWLFHGAKDPVVPVDLSRELATEFNGRNMEYNYTEYPDGGHDVWNKAWDEPKLIPWIFSKKRKTKE